ncbi:MAG: SufD family Fe-S cluster assembly protein, partial [Lachnospiraceae bacterium]|nr:SufD family Fe-S cluster assembly protein [Lachnospiraceae bacterium]
VGAGADVLIVAGCGIHNCGEQDSEHDGVHRFFLEKGAKVKYVEKHYGEGTGSGKRILNPVTEATLDEDASMEMEMVQIEGVSSTKRVTTAKLGKGASLIVHERLMTHGDQSAYSEYTVELNGENSSANVVSRSVAKDRSYQKFVSRLHGNAKSAGHSECDSIIMDHAKIDSIPEILANSTDAELIHEAAIGKIAGDQIMKLMTLGLSEAEAESEIVNGFLK